MKNKITPYDTGKVKIGIYYQQPPASVCKEDLLVQRLYLGAGRRAFLTQKEIDFKLVSFAGALFALVCAAISFVR